MPYPPGVNYFALVENLKASEATFPSANEAVAELRPHSQTVHLHKISSAELRRLIDEAEPLHLALPFSVIAHEVTHWLDLVGTVWGQRYLVQLFDAYEAALVRREHLEEEWWKVIRWFDEDRRILFPRYYKTAAREDQPHDGERPWTIDYSCGHEFGADGRIDWARPIFFTTFGENPSRKRIARQPLSVGTLLETVATWTESLTYATLLDRMTDVDEKTVAGAVWSRERAGTLYDASLTEYTAPVHLLSARVHTREAMLSYHTGAAVAEVCLNLTEDHFVNLRIPDAFSEFEEKRLDAFRSAQDRGFAFACIAFNAPEFSKDLPINEWFAAALHNSNLPPIHIIHTDAFAKLEQLHRQTRVRWPLDRVRDHLLEAGRAVFTQRAEIGSEMTLMHLIQSGVILPLMFDSKGELFGLGKANLESDRFDPEAMFNYEWDLREFTTNFLMGCRGLAKS
jgi:hypothetical protein